MLWLHLSPQPLPAQGEAQRLIELRRRQVELRDAKARLTRQRELVRQGLVSETDLLEAESAVEVAQLGFQEALLTFLNAPLRVSILEAVKRRDGDGKKYVRLTIANLTPGVDLKSLQAIADFDGEFELPEELRTRAVRDVFVSLRDSGANPEAGGAALRGATVGLPYENHIPELAYGERRTMEFELLRDIDTVLVSIVHQFGEEAIDIHLKQAETLDSVTLSSTQISQEADLGKTVSYPLNLQRPTVDVRSFQLKVVNLPRQISYSFVDPNSEARLSRFSFPAGVTQQSLQLTLFLPERADQEEVRIDQPLAFWAIATDSEQEALFASDRNYTAAELEAARVGRVRLELIPRGTGRIELTATSLSAQVHPGERVEQRLTLHNRGSRRLDNVALEASAPLNWKVEVSPAHLQTLDVAQEASVQLAIEAPESVAVGDYEVRVTGTSFAYNRRVPTEDKLLRISVVSRPNLWGTGLLVGGLALTLLILAFVAVGFSRR